MLQELAIYILAFKVRDIIGEKGSKLKGLYMKERPILVASLGKFLLVFSQVCIYDAETSDALPPPPTINPILAFKSTPVLYFNNINPSVNRKSVHSCHTLQ